MKTCFKRWSLVPISAVLLVALGSWLLAVGPRQTPVVQAQPNNEMAVDAQHTGSGDTSIQASRTVNAGSPQFNISINVTSAAGGVYNTYLAELTWDPTIVDFVSGTHLSQAGFTSCFPFTEGTFASGPLVGQPFVNTSCGTSGGATSTFVGPHDRLDITSG